VETGVVDLLLQSYPRLLEMHSPWSEERDCTPLMRGLVDLDEVHTLLRENGYQQFELVDNGVIPRKSPTLDVEVTRAYHLVPRGVSKEQAVRKDQELRGIPAEATVAVGDAVADVAFSRAAGAFFMVRNGLDNNPDLAGVIDEAENIFVTEGEMGDGWAEVVETLLSLPAG
jgi:hydroxymethylpyrimidine pyrophosphatase-like HAD family hydrolase